ncbi:Rne/Rng family ribonuclease [Nigerium massiliense]|uniref:Rne/Rng family ribonuclease n=1 Tax=Nigerium massiliense TaxID=1522317 RepID=UPI0009E1A596|nr:Rne/Rng family ribonuclease [Nigerium massiliense]
MLDTDVPENNDSTASEPTRPRRRRAASRPAGPPAPVEARPAELSAPATPRAIEATEPDAVEAQIIEDPVAEAQPSDDAPAEEPTVDAGDQAGGEPEERELADEKADDPAADDRAIEETAAHNAAQTTDETGEDAPADSRDDQAIQGAPTENGERERPRRRKRASRPAGPPPEATEATEADADSGEDADDDPIAASLKALRGGHEGAGRRNERPTGALANPFGGSGTVEDALDGLAAVIARPAAQKEEPSDDEDDTDADEASEDRQDEGDEKDRATGSDQSDDEDEDQGPRRRRRRRGGRRRRRGGQRDSDNESDGDDDSDESDDEADDSAQDDADDKGAKHGDKDDADDHEADDKDAGDDEASSSGSSRRRRRRRRRGEDTGSTDDEGVDVVVKVREPRRSKSPNDEITSIEGSTRMEAKKQRRREGRAAGRRRAPILSEAEFLARRESVDRMMLIRQADDYSQIAVLEDGVLVEHYVDRDSSASMIGNIYLGRVQNVLPSMEAAFIDIGRGRNAVLYAGEVDWDSFGVTGADRKVEKVLKSGQTILVQVTKDPVGAKGARLTSHISIPGRYVVYSPGGQLSGISRKLSDQERHRLKGILDELIGEDASVIVRTAAEGASEEELVRDVNRLKAQWEVIEKRVKEGKAPQQLYAEPDLTVRIVRDLFTEDFSKLVVDGNGGPDDVHDTIQGYVTHVAPHLEERLTHWNRDQDGDLFDKFRVNEQVNKALERKVHLPSGGSLIIDRTEAMTVIDVNTGKFTGTQGNLEATVTSNNLEAAEEVVRQLRLRDIGGIIVIDFIDMVLPANRELLLRRLVECLGRDRTRHQVAEVTSLGLVQMTRKKIGTGLAEAFTVPCETCNGRGYHIHDAPVASQAPADGGDRDHHGRRGRNQRGGRSRNDDNGGGSNRRGPQGNSGEHGEKSADNGSTKGEPTKRGANSRSDRRSTAGGSDQKSFVSESSEQSGADRKDAVETGQGQDASSAPSASTPPVPRRRRKSADGEQG